MLVELTLTLTNLDHPQQTPPLLFVDNECAIGLAISSVRPKKSKSIDMCLDWIKERTSQNVFRLVFLPGLTNPADFFTKILPIYRHIAALPFLHANVPTTANVPSRRDAVRDRDQPTTYISPPLTLNINITTFCLPPVSMPACNASKKSLLYPCSSSPPLSFKQGKGTRNSC